MEHVRLESIYSEILLLSNTERDNLYNRIQKDFYRDSNIVAYTTAGKPLTESEYIEQINIGLMQIENGETITNDELEKEIATW
jgi:hypothetical protein